MKQRKLLLLLLILFPLEAAFSQSVPLKTGTTLTYRVAQNFKQAYVVRSSAIYRFRLLDKLPDGGVRVESTLLDYHDSVENTHLDRERILGCSINSTNLLLQVVLLNEPVALIVNKDGSTSLEPATKKRMEEKIAAFGVLEEHMNTMMTGFNMYLRSEAAAIFFPFTLQKETAWSNMDSTMLYAISGTPGGIRQIVVKFGPVYVRKYPSSEINCKYDWDESNGKILKALEEYRMTGAEPLYSSTRLELIDDAAVPPPVSVELKEVAIKTSFWSNALKNGRDMDSARLYAFMAKYDPLLGRQKFYVQRKLSMLQSLQGTMSYQVYDDSLRNTPNYLLEGNGSHLHNKLQDAINQDADSAMTVIGYLAHAPGSLYRDWIQRSYAQTLLYEWTEKNRDEAVASWRKEGLSEERINRILEEDKVRRKVAKTLATRMAGSTDAAVSSAAYPINLYYKATQQTHIDSLRKLINAFKALPTTYSQNGNSNRYFLMLQKLLTARGHNVEAAAVLDNAIAKLERDAVDSTSNRRYEDQNMLAYAYQLKSASLKTTDSRKALEYLGKAAAVSPRSVEEKAYDSFYDRLMLGSEESYRQAFANELFRKGDTREAMMVLTQQVNANPSMLPEVQKAFEKHLPDQDFKTFFDKVISKSWKTAPDFALTGVDGKTYKLSDYRGKWVLLDFWGTWCSPCRRELPRINAYAKKIAGSTERSLLTISCSDTPADVQALFSKEGYDIPVGMSDGKVQGSYKVKGYPSKYVISPDGKILELGFTQDWDQVFDAFSGIKPSPQKNKLKTPVLKN